ncbi:hypothetical protein [Bariatricus sp. SGI.019]|uniref:hypothetical protein n=1 Tax=Bariatricus sp. SGI.019 TaxID=3420548 RepID=UPI003CFF7A93
MTLDEAILHAREVAERNRRAMSFEPENNIDDDIKVNCLNCATQHEQLAEWLEELKFLRQWKSDIMDEFCKYDVSSFEELVTNTRNKAIDDFVTKYKFCDNRSIQCRKALNCADCIAEQLKAGITND